MRSVNTRKYCLSILCILIGPVIGLIRPPGKLTAESMRYLNIFMTAVLLLILWLYPAPLIVLFICIAFITFHVCALPEVFSAWNGDTMWTIVLIMISATGIARTGLIDRVAYNITKLFPATCTGMIVAVVATSTILSPIVPNSYSKYAVLRPSAASVARASNIKKGSRTATELFCAFFAPAAIHTMAFLTGSAMTFVLIGMIGDGYAFSWTE